MEAYNDFVQRLEEIRRLSTPSMKGIANADRYSEKLRDNFVRIGKLAAENRAFLNSVLLPTIRSDAPLSREEADKLLSLGETLLSAQDAENLDLSMMALISERLLHDAENREDLLLTIRRLDVRMDTCYALMNVMGRSSASSELCRRFRQEGFRIGNIFLDLLRRDRFEQIPDDDCREIILTDVRYMAVFYEGFAPDDPEQREETALLDKILALADDPYYHRMLPRFDWRYFRYRALNYYAKVTDLHNIRGFDAETLGRVCDRTEDFDRLWRSDPDYFSRLDSEKKLKLLVCRNRYLAGRLDAESYREVLRDLYRRRDPDRYDLNGIYENLEVPAEAMFLYDPARLTPEDAASLGALYRDMIRYAFRMPNENSLSTMLEYYIGIINRFIEVPGGLTFEDMMLNCLAALHPPTYIHSVMVSRLSRCFCARVIERDPAQLVGVLGCATPEEVVMRREALCDFAGHAGLCHDFGKLAIIDTIFVYGRDLFEMEFGLIQTHPRIGYEMLTRYESTRAYADAALGHHRWYDNSRGYPRDFDVTQSPIKPIIDLLLCADCLDAATDSVGRSYRAGKTYDDFLSEIQPELGQHYAPWLWDILTAPDSRREIEALLTDGRRDTYRDTYYLLRKMTGD